MTLIEILALADAATTLGRKLLVEGRQDATPEEVEASFGSRDAALASARSELEALKARENAARGDAP